MTRSSPWDNGAGLYYDIANPDTQQIGSGAYGKFKLSQFDIYTTALTPTQVAAIGNGVTNAITTTVTIPQTSGAASATGGTDTLTLSMSPTNLPGITYDSVTNKITADSTTPVGTYYETITAVDRLGVTGSTQFTIVIDSAIAFTTGSNIITTKGIARSSDTFTATLGTGTKTYSLSDTITGISIDTVTGVVRVANTVDSGTYYETVVATDLVGAKGYKPMYILVNVPVVIGGGSNVTTTYGRSDSSFAFIASGGTTPLRFSILPYVAGIRVDSVSGIVYVQDTTTPGTYLETVTVTDSVTAFATKTLTIQVNAAIQIVGGPVNTTGSINFGNSTSTSKVVTLATGSFPDTLNDFDVSFWQYINASSFTSSGRAFSFGTWPSARFGLSEERNGVGCPGYCFWINGSYITNSTLQGLASLPIFNQWSMLEVSRVGSNIYFFVNGSLISTVSNSTQVTGLSSAPFGLGNESTGGAQLPANITNFLIKNVG
jgi:hypothetical protein